MRKKGQHLPDNFTLPDGFTLPADTSSSGPGRHSTPGDVGACPDLSILAQRPAWQRRAACLGLGPARWFDGDDEATAAAVAICRDCRVQHQCLEYALSNPSLVGIWAGTDERERRRMRRASA
jgi:WhiB family redox-sensing transcriptional regulator